jgi:hypothetical protein
VFVHALRAALLDGRTTFIHDVLYWTYPVHRFLADNLLQGRLPYWNPFSHAGEPLYPLFLQLRLLDPLGLLTLAIARWWTTDLTTLFNWTRVTSSLVGSVGAYLFLRQWTPHAVVRIGLIPAALWSSLALSSFRQTGTNDMFIYAPYVAYFLFRILHFEDQRWRTWIGLGLFVGLGWQSYYFVGIWLFVLFVVIGFALFRRDALLRSWRAPGVLARAGAVAALVLLMGTPNLVVLAERGAYVFPPRLVDHDYEGRASRGFPLQHEPGPSAREDRSVLMPYSLIRYTGSSVSLWDFVLATAPGANRPLNPNWPGPPRVGRPSELSTYLGLLVYGGALLGLIAGRHRDRAIWLVTLAGFGLLVCGPSGGLHWVLYHVYPPLWFLRHTHLLLNFVVLALLYFFVLGANRLVECRGRGLFEPPSDEPPPRGAGPVSRLSGALAFARYVGLSYVIVMVGLTLMPHLSGLWGGLWPTALVTIVLAVALTGALAPRLGGAGLFWGIVTWHALVALTFYPERTIFLTRLLAFFAVPLLLLWAVRRLRPRATAVAIAGLAAVLAIDVGEYLYASSVFWSAARPEQRQTVPAGPGPARFTNTRLVTVGPTPEYEQSIRYLELAAQVPTAFSSVQVGPQAAARVPAASVADVLGTRRWSSLLLLRGYFDLIHSGIAPPVLAELLAVGGPLLQFRASASVVPLAGFSESLRGATVPEALRRLRRSVILHDPAAPAVMDPGDGSAPDRLADFRVLRYDPDSLEVAIDAPTNGFLYYADGYDRHWRADVDGRRAPVLRANAHFKAVFIGAGRHEVTLRYDPVPFKVSLMLFFGTPLVAVLGLAIARGGLLIRARRPAPVPGRRDPPLPEHASLGD